MCDHKIRVSEQSAIDVNDISMIILKCDCCQKKWVTFTRMIPIMETEKEVSNG